MPAFPVLLRRLIFHPADPEDVKSGVVGHVHCTLNNGLVVEDIDIRKDDRGILSVMIPEAVLEPAEVEIVRHLDEETRVNLEEEVLDEVRYQLHNLR